MFGAVVGSARAQHNALYLAMTPRLFTRLVGLFVSFVEVLELPTHSVYITIITHTVTTRLQTSFGNCPQRFEKFEQLVIWDFVGLT